MYTKLGWGTRVERHGERRGFESWGADHVVPGMSRSDRNVEVRVYSRVTVGMSMHPTGTTSIRVASVRAGAGEAAPDAVHDRPTRVELSLYRMLRACSFGL